MSPVHVAMVARDCVQIESCLATGTVLQLLVTQVEQITCSNVC